MKKGIKKTLVMLLSLAMVFTMMAMPVYADDLSEGEPNEAIIEASMDAEEASAEEAEQIAEPEAEVQESVLTENEEPVTETVQEEAAETDNEEPTALEQVLASIGELSNDPCEFTTDDKERVEAINTAYEALSAEDQATVDSTFDHPSGDGQSYGRVLEAALWTVRSFGTDASTTLTDGTYTTTTEPAVSSESSKGKSDSSRVRNWWVESVVVENGKATAYIYVTAGEATAKKVTSYPSVWIGGETVERNADNNYPIPVDLNGTTYFGGISSSMPRPIMYELKTEIEEPAPQPAYTPGWHKIDGDWYYYNEDGTKAVNEWKKDSKGWCYLGEDGKMVTNDWAKDKLGFVRVGSDGYMITGTKWLKVDGIWYHITNGYRDQSKWMKDSKGWCYLGEEGAMVTNGWAKDSKGYCWIGSDGYMVEKTQWLKLDGSWYHITKGYRDQSKWMKDSKGWCYLGAEGAMVTNGWAKDSKGYCWMGSDGYMVEKTQWLKLDGTWYHITKGYRDQSTWMKDSKGWCYLDKDGKMVTEDWAKDSKGYCWIGSEGYMIEEDMWIGEEGQIGSSYIVKGYRVDGKTMTIDGKEYIFDNEGKLTYGEATKIPYEGNTVNFINANGKQYGMFTPQEGTTFALDGDNIAIHYVPKNKTTYAGFNWGTVVKAAYKDESAQPEIEVKANEDGSYDLTLSKEYMGYAHPIAVVKNQFGKGSWTSAEQYYLAVPTITEPVELAITNNTGMFKAVSAYLQTEGKQEYLVMALSSSGYYELAIGTYEQAVANGDGTVDKGNGKWIHGYQNALGKWEFKIPVSADDTYVPCVAVSDSYYKKYVSGTNSLARAFYPRQFEINREAKTLVTGDYEYTQTLEMTNNVKMFSVSGGELFTVGGPNSNNYASKLILTMKSTSFDKAYVGRAKEIGEGTETIAVNDANAFEMPVKWVETFGDPETMVSLIGKPFVACFHSKKNDEWYERQFTISEEDGTLVIDEVKVSVDDLDGMTEEEAGTYAKENASVEFLNELIEAIQVQSRDENTDVYCTAAKACWDALSEEDKLLDDGYFSDDTGDASEDDPLNTAPDKEKELLVVSFGTSFNDSRVATIGAVEKALATAYGDEYAVRRAFTAQIIINHVQSRDGEKIDNVTQAMDKAVAAGVKEMVVQPTHLMSGAEFDELKAEIDKYAEKINIVYAKPLLDSDADKEAVAKAAVAAAVKDAGFASLEAADADKTAFVFMGHGTSHDANVTYTQMQQTMDTLGYANCFVGTVEGKPASTALPEVKKALEAKGYTKVVLRPLMVVAGDHANNDMAADEEGSWYYAFVNGGEFEVEGQDTPVDIGEGLGKENVTCQVTGLGEIEAIQQLYVAHTAAAMAE